MPSPDLLLAILLLTASPGTYEPTPSEGDFPAVRAAVHQVAVEVEILDVREISYIFNKRCDFEADLDLLRKRYQQFKDAPRLADAERLPDRKTINEMVAFNRAYRKHLCERHALELDRAEIFEAAMIETDNLYKIYDSVRDARCDFYYSTVRRSALMRLKEMIGDEDFAAVNLPPNVPTHRFTDK